VMFDVAVLLAKQIDKLVAKRLPTYKPILADAIARTRKVRSCRLLRLELRLYDSLFLR